MCLIRSMLIFVHFGFLVFLHCILKFHILNFRYLLYCFVLVVRYFVLVKTTLVHWSVCVDVYTSVYMNIFSQVRES